MISVTIRTFATVIIALVGAAIPTRLAVAQDARDLYLSNVVAITVENSSGGKIGSGYGLIVGRRSSELWVATAEHILFAPGARRALSPQTIGMVAASWRGAPAKHKLSGRAVFPNHLADIVFVPFESPASVNAVDLWLNSVIAHEPKPGERLWLVSGGGVINVHGTGYLVTAQGKDGPLSAVHGEPGQSGSPIIAHAGIVGLYHGVHGSSKGDFTTISALREAALANDVPWQLNFNDEVDSTTAKLCVVHTGPERPNVRLIGNGFLQLDSSGCVDAVRTSYGVDTQDAFIGCEPPRVSFSSAANSVALNCYVNPLGFWPNGSMGGAQLRLTGPERYEFAGINFSPHGRIAGEVQGIPPEMLIQGTTSTNHAFFGKLTVHKRQLHGELTVDTGETVTFSLSR